MARQDWWRRPALAVLFLAVAYLAAERALPVHPAPKERPPKIVAMPPAEEIHTSRNGYVISVSLVVENCSDPVRGSITVVLPREFFEKEQVPWVPQLKNALFGVAVSDPSVEVIDIAPEDLHREPQVADSWWWPFADAIHADADGVVAVARFDGWRKQPDQLEMDFVADWLRPRGYGSCWLATPELVGDLQVFSVNAADEVNQRLGSRSGADHLSMGVGGGGVITFESEDGSREKHKFKEPFAWEYLGAFTPPSVGYVSLHTPMSVLAAESVGPAPSVGTPSWACRDRRGGPLARIDTLGLGQDSAFRWNDADGLQEYLPAENHSRCDSWVALVEPGAQSERDLWLLVVGAALSAGVALLVESTLLRPRRRRNSA
jgi:hypothetical protein